MLPNSGIFIGESFTTHQILYFFGQMGKPQNDPGSDIFCVSKDIWDEHFRTFHVRPVIFTKIGNILFLLFLGSYH